MLKSPRFFAITLTLLMSIGANAAVQPAGIFTDHMVLQRNASNPVWGTATPGEYVTVTIARQTRQAIADPAGHWRVTLAQLPTDEPLTMTIAATNTVTIKDILVGEVWLCSGQSNMAFKVSASDNYDQEKAAAKHPTIREFKVGAAPSPKQLDNVSGAWTACSPDTVGAFSASAYFFARSLQNELNVPIGIITSASGGTDVLAWTSYAAQSEHAALRPTLAAFEAKLAKNDAAAKKANTDKNSPARLFNGMINPLIGYGMKGAIWYQGERNSKTVEEGSLYVHRLSTLITDWRNRWNIGNFPFIAVQLPDFHAPQSTPIQTTGWVMVRDGIRQSTLDLPNTGMAVALGLGMQNNIHPTNKQDVGYRLALWALANTYEHDVTYSGPSYMSAKSKNGALTINFDHVADGLVAQKGDAVTGFAIAGDDQVFHIATAEVNGSSITLTSADCPKPVAARYAWADNPHANLFNTAGLPASPFRTDDWDVTKEAK